MDSPIENYIGEFKAKYIGVILNFSPISLKYPISLPLSPLSPSLFN
jgi:hypothetical protein